MALKRSEGREKAMIILYQIEIMKNNKVSYDVNSLIKDNLEIENEFVKDLVYGVETHYDELNELANKYLIDWEINRIDKTGASILRMAIYELLYFDTPQIVVINEAINLAKKYSDEDVRKMINGLLDRMIKDYER